MRIGNSNPQSDRLEHSIATILAIKDKTSYSGEVVSQDRRINEEELYASIVHERLSGTDTSLADRFQKEIAPFLEKWREERGETLFFKAGDRVLRNWVRRKVITQDEYRSIKEESIGRAQLDSDRTRLSTVKVTPPDSTDTPVREIRTALRKVTENSKLTESEHAQFRAHEAQISKAKWSERHSIGNTSPILQGTQSIDSKGEATSETTQTTTLKEVPPGFLWKPSSDKDGRLVVLLPFGLTTEAVSVKILSPDGKRTIENGTYAGIGNGLRQHYRFSESGASYPGGLRLDIGLRDGQSIQLVIQNPQNRIE